jgi:ABC-2 type transport system permease protein
MSADARATTRGVGGAQRPVWWLVFRQELDDLWVGGKALNLLILFAVLMSITAFLLATNNELSLTPPRLMIVITIQSAITFGLFIGLVIACESLSGERERATLEPLLLAPAGRRQIVLGKFLAALSPWPIAYAFCVPYVLTLAQGDLALWPALAWGAVLGTLVTVAFTGIGVLISIYSGSSRNSLFVGLLVYVLALLPAQLPGEFLDSPAGALIQALDPLEAVRVFLMQGFVDVRPVEQLWPLLYAPVIVTVLVFAAIFVYAAPRLGLTPDAPRWPWSGTRGSEAVG